MTADGDFIEICLLAEQAHRQLLEMIQASLQVLQVPGVNAIRALMLLKMRETEMTFSEVRWGGCYSGTNPHYNIKKLTAAGYLIQKHVEHDKRLTVLRISEKGLELRASLIAMNAAVFGPLTGLDVSEERLASCAATLRTLRGILNHAKDTAARASGLAA